MAYHGVPFYQGVAIVPIPRRSMYGIFNIYPLLAISMVNVGTYTSSSRASRWRKFQKKKELYSKERIGL